MILYLYRTNWNIRCFFSNRGLLCAFHFILSLILLYSFLLNCIFELPCLLFEAIAFTHQLHDTLAFYKMIFSYRVCGDGVKCRGGGISTIISLRKGHRFLSQRLWLNLNLQQSIVRYEGGKKLTWEKTSVKDVTEFFVGRSKNIVFVNFCISCIINCVSVGVLAQWEIQRIKENASQGHWNKMKEVRKIMKCSLRREVSNSFFQHV